MGFSSPSLMFAPILARPAVLGGSLSFAGAGRALPPRRSRRKTSQGVPLGSRANAGNPADLSARGMLRSSGRARLRRSGRDRRRARRPSVSDPVSLADRTGTGMVFDPGRRREDLREDGGTAPARLRRFAGIGRRSGPARLGTAKATHLERRRPARKSSRLASSSRRLLPDDVAGGRPRLRLGKRRRRRGQDRRGARRMARSG